MAAENAPAAPASTPAAAGATAADAPPAWFAAHVAATEARFAAVEGAKAKAEADAKSAIDQKLTLEQQVAKQGSEMVGLRVRSEFADVLSGHKFVSQEHREAAVKLFRNDYKVDVQGDSVLAFGPDGKPQHLASAFEAFTKTAVAKNFIASPIQPGGGAPAGSAPEGAKPVDIATMPKADFDALVAKGITGKLTPNSPYDVTIRSRGSAYNDIGRSRIANALRYGGGGKN